MSLMGLAWKNIRGNAFRSLAIVLCAALVSGLALTATFVVRGAEANLRSSLQKLGADLLLLPWGTMTEKIGGVRLMSAAIDGWMPRAYLDKVGALDEIAQISPQLHLATLHDSAYSPQSDIYIVAFDPESDFTLRPWMESDGEDPLQIGEVIAGSRILLPTEGDELYFYGSEFELSGRLAATGTSIDRTVFVNFETAERMVARSDQSGTGALNIMPGSISAMMVKVELGSDPHDVAARILEEVPGVVPLETPDLFQMERRQMIGILRTLVSLLAGVWVLVLVFMALVLSIAANERRLEIGILRALGSPGRFILKTLLLEGGMLAVAGGSVGVAVTIIMLTTVGEVIMQVTHLPLQYPSVWGLVSLSLGGQALALASVTMAAFIPAWRISREEVALAMRE